MHEAGKALIEVIEARNDEIKNKPCDHEEGNAPPPSTGSREEDAKEQPHDSPCPPRTGGRERDEYPLDDCREECKNEDAEEEGN